MTNVTDLRNMNVDELNIKLKELYKEQFYLRLKKSNGLLEKSHLLKNAKIRVAQIKTIIAEKNEIKL